MQFRHREIIWSQVIFKNVFLTFAPLGGEGGRISQNPVLVGIRASKPICTQKFVTQSSIELPGPYWVIEWVSDRTLSFMYIDLLIVIFSVKIFKNISASKIIDYLNKISFGPYTFIQSYFDLNTKKHNLSFLNFYRIWVRRQFSRAIIISG